MNSQEVEVEENGAIITFPALLLRITLLTMTTLLCRFNSWEYKGVNDKNNLKGTVEPVFTMYQ